MSTTSPTSNDPATPNRSTPPPLSKRPSLLSFLSSSSKSGRPISQTPTLAKSIDTDPSTHSSENSDQQKKPHQSPHTAPAPRARTRTRTTSNPNISVFTKHRPEQYQERENERRPESTGDLTMSSEVTRSSKKDRYQDRDFRTDEDKNEHGKRHVRSYKASPPRGPAPHNNHRASSPSATTSTILTSRSRPISGSSIVPVPSKPVMPNSPDLPFAENKVTNIAIRHSENAARSIQASEIPLKGGETEVDVVEPTAFNTISTSIHPSAQDEEPMPRIRQRTLSSEGDRAGRPVGGIYDRFDVDTNIEGGATIDTGSGKACSDFEMDSESDEEGDEEDEDEFGCTGASENSVYRSRGLDNWSSNEIDAVLGSSSTGRASRSTTSLEKDDPVPQLNRWSAVRYTPGPALDLSSMEVDPSTGKMYPRPADFGRFEDEVKPRERGIVGGKLKKKDSGLLRNKSKDGRDGASRGFVGMIKNVFPISGSQFNTPGLANYGATGNSASSSLDSVSQFAYEQMSPLEKIASRRNSGVAAGHTFGLGLGIAEHEKPGWAMEEQEIGVPVEMEIPRVILTPAEGGDGTCTPIILHETYSPMAKAREFFSPSRATPLSLKPTDRPTRSRSPPAAQPHPMSARATSAWSKWSSSTTDFEIEQDADGRSSCEMEGSFSPVTSALDNGDALVPLANQATSGMSVTPELEEADDDLPLGQVVLRRAKQKNEDDLSPTSTEVSHGPGREGVIEANVVDEDPRGEQECLQQVVNQSSMPFPASPPTLSNDLPSTVTTSTKRRKSMITHTDSPARKNSAELVRPRTKAPPAPLGMGRPQLSQFDGVKCVFDLPPVAFTSRAIHPGARQSIIMPKRKEEVLSDLADKKAERRRTRQQSGPEGGPTAQRIPAPKMKGAPPPVAAIAVDTSEVKQERPSRVKVEADPLKPSIRLIVTKDLPTIGPGAGIEHQELSGTSARDLPTLFISSDSDEGILDIANKAVGLPQANKRGHRTSLKGMLQSRRNTRTSAMMGSTFPDSVRETELENVAPSANPAVARWVQDSAQATADDAKRAKRLTLKRSMPSLGRKNSGASAEGEFMPDLPTGKTLTKRFSLASLKDVFKGKSKSGWDTEESAPPMPTLPRQYSADRHTSDTTSPVFALAAALASPPALFDGPSGNAPFALSDQSSDDLGSPEMPRSAAPPDTPPVRLVTSDTLETEGTNSSLAMSDSHFTSTSSMTAGSTSEGELAVATPIVGARRASNIQLFTFPPHALGPEVAPTVFSSFPAERPVVVSKPAGKARPKSVAGMLGLKTGRAKIDEMIESLASSDHDPRQTEYEIDLELEDESDMQKLDSMHFNEDGLGIDFGQWRSAVARSESGRSIDTRP